ncbi:MAG: cytochrome c [Bacteroidota bacterium]
MIDLKNITKFGAFIVLVVTLASCEAEGDYPGLEYAPQMYHSIPYEPLKQITDESQGKWLLSIDSETGEFYNSNPYNPNRMTMRKPPEHSVKRDGFDYLPYRIPKDSLDLAARVTLNPVDSTAAIVKEGKALYGRFCQHCHGEKGLGDGSVGKVYKGVTSYTSASVKDKPGGHIFHVITHGKGRMGAHGSQISTEDRWKIVRYVNVLQNQ